ncbi:hypothetical protein [Micromonospora sp. NPDC005113]
MHTKPNCHCLAICASQPMTPLAPQINGAVFLDISGALWYVPSLGPGHGGWRYATCLDVGHPLFRASTRISDFLRETHAELLLLRYSL